MLPHMRVRYVVEVLRVRARVYTDPYKNRIDFGMIRDYLEKDGLLRLLLEGSSLTEVQLDALLISLRMGAESLDRQAGMRDGGKVSVGSFARSLEQARLNVRRSLHTLALLQYLGFASSKDLHGILSLGEKITALMGRSLSQQEVKAIHATVDGAFDLVMPGHKG